LWVADTTGLARRSPVCTYSAAPNVPSTQTRMNSMSSRSRFQDSQEPSAARAESGLDGMAVLLGTPLYVALVD